MGEKKCCHDLTSKSCTIKILKRKFMVEPNVVQGVCTCCGKSFKYKEFLDIKNDSDADSNVGTVEEDK